MKTADIPCFSGFLIYLAIAEHHKSDLHSDECELTKPTRRVLFFLNTMLFPGSMIKVGYSCNVLTKKVADKITKKETESKFIIF